jgi:hypothetical protein
VLMMTGSKRVETVIKETRLNSGGLGGFA